MLWSERQIQEKGTSDGPRWLYAPLATPLPLRPPQAPVLVLRGKALMSAYWLRLQVPLTSKTGGPRWLNAPLAAPPSLRPS